MSEKNAEAVADTKKEKESQSVTVSANGKPTEKEASPEKQTECEGGLELFTEDESTRVLRKVKIIDRSKEFQGKGESKKEDKKDEVFFCYVACTERCRIVVVLTGLCIWNSILSALFWGVNWWV